MAGMLSQIRGPSIHVGNTIFLGLAHFRQVIGVHHVGRLGAFCQAQTCLFPDARKVVRSSSPDR